mmetsp:Transcript_29673/g.40994  ORF Transcript_29673/g.40994 Transcript_29673/m.40994 type:complete len:209 (+) Transcript_29673:8-634(+)
MCCPGQQLQLEEDSVISTIPKQKKRIKIIVVGEPDAGKTCLVQRYVEGMFSLHAPPTIGASSLVKKIPLAEGEAIELEFWDTAGSERYRSLVDLYYRGAHVVILAFDVTKLDADVGLLQWKEELDRKPCLEKENVLFFVVGTKIDLKGHKLVQEKVEKWCQSAKPKPYPYFEVSSKENIGVDQMFDQMIEIIKENFIQRNSKVASGWW